MPLNIGFDLITLNRTHRAFTLYPTIYRYVPKWIEFLCPVILRKIDHFTIKTILLSC